MMLIPLAKCVPADVPCYPLQPNRTGYLPKALIKEMLRFEKSLPSVEINPKFFLSHVDRKHSNSAGLFRDSEDHLISFCHLPYQISSIHLAPLHSPTANNQPADILIL